MANCQLVSPAEDLPLSNITLPVLGERTIVNGADSGKERGPSGSETDDTAEEGGVDGEV